MIKDVRGYIRGCRDCQARKGSTNRKPLWLLQPIKVGRVFDQVGIDLLGPFRKSSQGKTTIIVVTDYASRYAITAALPIGKAGPVAKFLFKVFQSEIVQKLQQIMGMRSIFTNAYHPSCNGLTERLNKTLADKLSLYCSSDQTDWCS